MVVFLILSLCELPKEPTVVEGQHREEIVNIAPAVLVSVQTNTRKRFTQFMDSERRHLSDFILKTK